jgi:glycosyltransferase involved in cell wall biosynthesis
MENEENHTAAASSTMEIARQRSMPDPAEPSRQTLGTVEHPIRATIVQPALAKYRIAVFRELASRPGIKLRVVYGAVKGLDNVPAEGFEAVPSFRWQARGLVFNPADWTYASRKHSDVVIFQWTPRSASLPLALLRARAGGAVPILWGHGYAKDERGRRRGARKLLAKGARALVFYEPTTRDEYIRDGWDPKECFVALNSLDHSEMVEAREWWLARPEQLDKFRKQHRIDGGPMLLFVSRLHADNRVELLIQATARLAQEFPGLKTVIIGNGAGEKARLQAVARENGATGSVVFLGGIYDEWKLAPWFVSAAVFCYPANVGLSIIHAFWYGVPIVTSDYRAIHNPEFVALEHGVNGLTYQHLNLDAMTGALRQIVTDPALRTSMSHAARRTVEQRFTIPRMVDGLEAAIRYASSTVRTPG